MKQIAPFLLVATLLLAGCAGKGDAEDVVADPTLTTETTSDVPPTPTEDPNQFVPKFHTHDYWAGREKLKLFDKSDVPIGEDVLAETAITNTGIIIGQTIFDTKLDGEHVGVSDGTDVVYQGTERIEVTITWTDTNAIPGINFYYKPANSPSFTLLGPMETGKTATIFLREHQADMPHQMSLSRWKFKLEAFDPSVQSMPMKAYRARGEVGVVMDIFNGGDQFIDPPHPYFFTNGPTRYAGEVNKTYSNCVYVNNTRRHESQPSLQPVSYGCTLNEWGPEIGHIVPWETTKLVVHMWYNNTAATNSLPRALGLRFHGSDTSDYAYPRAVESKAGYAMYEIGVTEAMTDSPYARQTDWRFGVYPILNGEKDVGGDMNGNVHILAIAVSEGANGRGMGN